MSKFNRYASLRISVAVSALVLAAGQARSEDFVIGVATAQTGQLAPYDQPALAGFKLAIEDINAKGGLAGKYKVKLVVKDTRSDTAQSATAGQELLDEGAKVMITPCDADPSIAVGQLTQPLQIATITLCGTAPILTGAVGDVMFGSFPADNLQATAIADFAIAQGKKTAYLLVSPDSSYTAFLPEYFGKVFEAKGGKVLDRGSFTMGQPDFSAEVTKIKGLATQPDIIVTSAMEPDFPAFIRQLRAAGVNIPIYGADAMNTPTIKGLGSLVEGLVFTSAGYPQPGSKLEVFNKEFTEKVGHAPETTYEANGYEIGMIIDQAVKNAGSDDPAAIRAAIANLKDFEGLTGKITYAGTTGMPVRDIVLMQYKGGNAEYISTVTPTPSDVPAP